MTATTGIYLIERVPSTIKSHKDGCQVDLCKLVDGRWLKVRRNISSQNALDYGFNAHSPEVNRVFRGA